MTDALDSSGILTREPAAEEVKISHQICFKRLFEDLSLEQQNIYNLRSAVLLCADFSRGVVGGAWEGNSESMPH